MNVMTVKEFNSRFNDEQRAYLTDVTSHGLQSTGYDATWSWAPESYSSTNLFVAGAWSFIRYVLTRGHLDEAIAPGLLNDFVTAFSWVLEEQKGWYEERLDEETFDGELAEEYVEFFARWNQEIGMLSSIVGVLKDCYHDAWVGLSCALH